MGFEIDFDQAEITLEQLQQQQAEILAQAETIKLAIEKAKKKKREQDLHKIVSIVKQLHEEYGEDFVQVVKKEINLKPKKIVLSEEEKEEYVKFKHLFDRGYTVIDGQTFSHAGNLVASNIPAQKMFKPYFTMSPKVYARLFEKYGY